MFNGPFRYFKLALSLSDKEVMTLCCLGYELSLLQCSTRVIHQNVLSSNAQQSLLYLASAWDIVLVYHICRDLSPSRSLLQLMFH